jgi:dihydrofolate reductase
MIVSLIVAMDENRGIGFHNQVPWRLAGDLKHFKAVTMGHHLIVGRKTYESIGRALPGRRMIVVTRQAVYASRLPEGVLAAHSLEQALELAREAGESEVFVAGGGEIYRQALPLADRIYLTKVKAAVQADVYFPYFNESEWQEGHLSHFDTDEKNQYPYSIEIMERN